MHKYKIEKRKFNCKRKMEEIKMVKKKVFFKHEKGITLVALVITIIVLLILAGITINLTIRRKWIIKKN